ncbi:MAG: hypothetical protein HONBIEJF_00343 [Fimbriimonadaceae bacterium]|nr:hypothetical protein [Fimbriimonadaceae bacterium]
MTLGYLAILLQSSLLPGQSAPAFELRDEVGTVRRLEDYRGKRLLILFWPKDFTPG